VDNPQWRRFINADVLFIAGCYLTAANMFAYCNNNPVMFVDPTGIAAESQTSRFFGGIRRTLEAVSGLLVALDIMQRAIVEPRWYGFDLTLSDGVLSDLYTNLDRITATARGWEHFAPLIGAIASGSPLLIAAGTLWIFGSNLIRQAVDANEGNGVIISVHTVSNAILPFGLLVPGLGFQIRPIVKGGKN